MSDVDYICMYGLDYGILEKKKFLEYSALEEELPNSIFPENDPLSTNFFETNTVYQTLVENYIAYKVPGDIIFPNLTLRPSRRLFSFESRNTKP